MALEAENPFSERSILHAKSCLQDLSKKRSTRKAANDRYCVLQPHIKLGAQ